MNEKSMKKHDHRFLFYWLVSNKAATEKSGRLLESVCVKGSISRLVARVSQLNLSNISVILVQVPAQNSTS